MCWWFHTPKQKTPEAPGGETNLLTLDDPWVRPDDLPHSPLPRTRRWVFLVLRGGRVCGKCQDLPPEQAWISPYSWNTQLSPIQVPSKCCRKVPDRVRTKCNRLANGCSRGLVFSFPRVTLLLNCEREREKRFVSWCILCIGHPDRTFHSKRDIYP